MGPSIQIDPGYEYFQKRSPQSVASEIRVNGYKVVRMIVTNDDEVDEKLIEAFHAQGMKVWYQTFGNGFYGGPAGLPKGWESWKMGLINVEGDPGYTFLSLSHPEYRKWKLARMVATLRNHKFDAVEVVEPFQMGWEGPEKGMYGDFSPAALAAFQKVSGYDAPPEFKDKANARWYRTDTQRYSKWVDFRVHAVNEFLKEIGDGLRREVPGRPFCVWALANSSPDPKRSPFDLAREWQGIDAGEMANAAKADAVCFQTNWPDWSNSALPGDYPKTYLPFIEALRKKNSKVPFLIQADIGSWESMRRSREWIRLFEETCRKVGATGSTAYSYSMGLYSYAEAPEVREHHLGKDQVRLVFQKRLDAVSASDPASYRVDGQTPTSAKADGNEVTLTLKGIRKGMTLLIDGVKDDPKLWLFKDKPANTAHQKLKL